MDKPVNVEGAQQEYVMPCAEAMLAGTLALMTGHAQNEEAAQRHLMARKIRSNLFFLAQHPGISPAFRQIVERMHSAWDALLSSPHPDAAASAQASWVPACPTVQ
jgi:hypothetical protein